MPNRNPPSLSARIRSRNVVIVLMLVVLATTLGVARLTSTYFSRQPELARVVNPAVSAPTESSSSLSDLKSDSDSAESGVDPKSARAEKKSVSQEKKPDKKRSITLDQTAVPELQVRKLEANEVRDRDANRSRRSLSQERAERRSSQERKPDTRPAPNPNPTESLLKRAKPFDGDLRNLPYIPPRRKERPEREPPARVPVPSSPANTMGTVGADQSNPAAPSPAAPAPTPNITFDGLDFANWGAGHPPDTNGDVGPTHYIQTVNTSIGIYDKSTGTRVAAFTFDTFMSQGNFGNLCDTDNFGDPVVLYDTFEDRWIITDFAFQLDISQNVINPPGAFQCIAVSKTGDPVSGGWNYYSINTTGGLGDYPKFGIWPDGLYMSVNMFDYAAAGSFQNVRVYAFNKAQMYAGAPTVQSVSFNAPSSEFTILPANARLQTGTPPTGSPNYMAVVWNFLNVISVYKFHVDWNSVSTSTLTGPFNSTMTFWWEQFDRGGSVFTAPTPANALDTLYPRLMMQNQYSNISGVESLWNSHTVGAGNPTSNLTSTQSAVRYYQVNVTSGTVAANTTQSFTYSPDATIYRYMPSAAVDRLGDMAIGYTTSNGTTNPGLKYAGRLAGDAANSITQTEQTMFQGAGSQSGSCGGTCERWGDYSAMTLDPDGCTFWYTNEYYTTTGLNDLTRIGSFKLNPACTVVGNGTISGTVTTNPGGTPINGATVTLGSRTTTTDISGNYSFSVPAGTYSSMTASFPGRNSASASNIVVTTGGTTTQNFSLTLAATSGCFADTTQADFQTGVPTNVDLTTSPGNVILANVANLDQQQTTDNGNGYGFTNTSFTGQTFTPAVTGTLTQIDSYIFCASCSGADPNITLEVRTTSAGNPVMTAGGLLASATVAGSSSGSGGFFSFVFASPPSLTSGTQYGYVLRLAAARTGTQAALDSGSDVYAGGRRKVCTTASCSNAGGNPNTSNSDLVFKTYMKTGYSAGNLISGVKDGNPASGFSTNWTTLSWTNAALPAGTALKFQAAGSNNVNGPFNFVGPDGTAATFFTTSGASLSQFNGFRYLKYEALLSTSNSANTPTLNDVTVCYQNLQDLVFNANGSVAAGTYNSITVNAPAVVTLSGNVTITGFVLVNNGGTLNLGTSIISGGGTFTLTSGGILGIGSPVGITTSGATGNVQGTGLRTYNTGGSYVYNGAANQAVGNGLPATVANLTIANSGGGGNNTVTGNSGQTVTGLLRVQSGIYAGASAYNNVQIDSGAQLSAAAAMTVSGNWINDGTFNSGLNTVSFNGGAPQIISGASSTAFQGLTIGAAGVTMNSNGSVAGVLTLNGDLTVDVANGKILTATGSTSAGTKDVIGTIERSDVGTTTRAFGNPNNQITNGSAMTVQVLLVKSAPSGFAAAVTRDYTINPVSGSVSSATLRLHYLNGELNGNVGANLHLWRATGSPTATWTDQGAPSSSQTTSDPNNWIQNTGVTGFSSWTLASAPAAPTAVKLTKFEAESSDEGVGIVWESGFEVDNLGYHLYRERNGERTRVTPAVVAGSALKVGPRSKLTAGYAYSWFDSEGTADSAYYLESIDLHGGRVMIGPIYPTRGQGASAAAAKKRATMLGEVASEGAEPSRQNAQANWFEQSWPASMGASPNLKLDAKALTKAAAAGSPTSAATQQMIANGPAVKISVTRTGWYRVTQPELLAGGLDPNADPRRLQLFADGAEIPIMLNGGNGGRLEASDSIEFYGQALDTLSTDTHVYWLVNGSGPGKRLSRPKPAVKPNGQDWSGLLGGGFALTAERRDKMVYFSGLLNGEASNIFGAPVTSSSAATQSLTVSHADSAATQAQLSVTLQGVLDGNHQVQVQLNGLPVGVVSFQDREHPTQAFTIQRSLLLEGNNLLSLTALGGELDISLIDAVSLTYTHSYRADNNSLRFSVAAGQTVVVNGFNTSAIRVIDITNPATPNEVAPPIGSMNGGYAFKLQTTSNGGTRTYVAFTDDLAAHPAALTANQPSNLTSLPAADMLIVTHKDFRAAIEPLAAQRRSEGLTVAVVDIEDVYDEFSFGAHSPQALRDFLSWTNSHWAHAPRYLLLVGDSSWDPRNYLDQGFGDFVPTKLIDTGYMETASDDWLADFDGDGVADVAVGRLPGRTATDISRMVSKLIAYEQERQLGTPPRGALMVADSGFEGESQATAALLPSGITVQSINRAEVGSDDLTRSQIINGINNGPLVVNYFGHGSVTVWTGAGLLDSDLAGTLTNGNRQTFFVMMTCLNGYTHDAYIDSLAESLLKAENGGAMAVWASSGFTEPEPQFAMSSQFYRQLFGSSATRIGDAFKPAKAVISDPDVRRTWMLFGDPSMRIR